LCIESIASNSDDTNRVTFECYNKDSAQPLANVGLSNLLQLTSKNKIVGTGKERVGKTWLKLFSGLEKD
jgi:hypothetical protein